MTIRRAHAGDLEGLNRLLYQVLDVHREGRPDLFKSGAKKYTDDELKILLSDDERPVFAAVDDEGTMLGYAFCVLEEYRDHNIFIDSKTLYIDDLCVEETCRGQHIGKALYEYAVRFAKENDCCRVTLNVWACNENARRFYEHLGFRPQKYGMEMRL